MKERAKKYFILADRYLETAKVVLETIINNNNSTCGFGCTMEEMERDLKINLLKSDYMILIPAIFNSFQSTELFLKGLLLLNGVETHNIHETSNMLEEVKNLYGKDSEVYKSINSFYNEQIEIIKDFKKENKISTTNELYEALRYPENNSADIKNKKYYSYDRLYGNGEIGKQYCKTLIKKMKRVKEAILQEYDTKY